MDEEKRLGSLIRDFFFKGLRAPYFIMESDIDLNNFPDRFHFAGMENDPKMQKVVFMILLFYAVKMAQADGKTNPTLIYLDSIHRLLEGETGEEMLHLLGKMLIQARGAFIFSTPNVPLLKESVSGKWIASLTDWIYSDQTDMQYVKAGPRS